MFDTLFSRSSRTTYLSLCPYEPCGRYVPILEGCSRHRGVGLTLARTRSWFRSLRNEGPRISYAPCTEYEHGQCSTERWSLSGVLHRLDGPALLHRRPDGSVREERWYVAGRRHRVGGPHRTEWDESGSVIAEEWCREDRRHRVDGPALLHSGVQWWFDDNPVANSYGIAECLRAAGADRAGRLLGESSYVVLLREGVTVEEILASLEGNVVSIEGIREVANGAPPEWVRAYETSTV